MEDGGAGTAKSKVYKKVQKVVDACLTVMLKLGNPEKGKRRKRLKGTPDKMTKYQRSLFTQMGNITNMLQADWDSRSRGLPYFSLEKRKELERKYEKLKQRWNATFQQA